MLDRRIPFGKDRGKPLRNIANLSPSAGLLLALLCLRPRTDPELEWAGFSRLALFSALSELEQWGVRTRRRAAGFDERN
jgi:hypothetical protein